MYTCCTPEEIKCAMEEFLSPSTSTPNCSNYQSARKLKADQCLHDGFDLEGTFHLTESVGPALRAMANYRYEKLKAEDDPVNNMKSYIAPIQEIIDKNAPTVDSEKFEEIYSFLNINSITINEIAVKEPFYQRYMRFTTDNNIVNLLKIIKELPKDWTIIQLTAPYNPKENYTTLKEYRSDISSLYISILKNDYLQSMAIEPFTVEVPANTVKDGEKPLFVELHSILEDNIKIIDIDKSRYNKKNVQKYWEQREEIDLRIKSVIRAMENYWLGGMRCLLTGKLMKEELRNDVRRAVEKCCTDWGFIRLSAKQKFLICNLLECCHSIPSDQIRRTLRIILTHAFVGDIRETMINDDFVGCGSCNFDFKKISDVCLKCLSGCFKVMHHFTLVDALKAFMDLANKMKNEAIWGELKNAKRHPVILIVDEWLDTFPWESMTILSNHPVSRMESIHFVYSLYKANEEYMEDGYYTIRPDNGFYLINPGNNLEKMEKRMSSFIRYWCPKWSGEVNKPPDPDSFVRQLKMTDMFLYCGHGDGSSYARAAGGAGVAGAGRLRAAALLAGCASTRTAPPAPRTPAAAAHHNYHTAHCPLVVGMLWEVTDYEVDKVVSSLIALVVPSEAPVPWTNVGKKDWSLGVLDVDVEKKEPVTHEPNILLAITNARRTSNYVMIASSVVARGLPVRILPN